MRVSKKFMTLLSVVVLSSVLSAAGNPSSFKDFDANSDGTISEKEFDTRKTANMTQRAEEGKQLKNAGNSPQFADLDTNKDGKLSTSEHAKGQQQHMQKQSQMKKQNKNKNKKKGKGQGNGKNSN